MDIRSISLAEAERMFGAGMLMRWPLSGGRAVRWVSDCQPGVIEVEFTDVEGVTHSLIDKLPIFGVPDGLGPDSVYPVPAEIGVDLVERLGDGTVIDLKTEAHNTDRMRYVVPSADIVH
ncbi:hypothetical protein [Nocardia abscessus]|uniref:hypothetical protein n=1 Tax=Nocardia abscessus TaxID=120957 RepID=UPI002453B48B|nr:hypothetical protein [Nocardia abscessus]